jgi:hypothetical protein
MMKGNELLFLIRSFAQQSEEGEETVSRMLQIFRNVKIKRANFQ